MGQSSQPHELGGGLKSRHVTMLSIAGVIGASLFVGSSVAIAEAGPAVLLAYLFAGLLVVMIMRMLAEMAVATPDTGSFSTYADKAIGRWAGYTIGWLYWWFWVLVIPLEANIAAMILHSWVPGIPIWLFSLVITLALTGSNLLSVKNYGEFEFWLALCKVIAILAFIFLGAVAISGFYPYAEVSGISRLWDSGGFMPNGFGAVLSAMLITMFSFMGAEIVTIAAAESDTPEKHIVRATNSVIWRISIFYLCSIFVVVALIPWNMPGLKAVGSYRSVLELLNIPHAKLIMDCVILLSVTSCLNSALYTASRMLYSLSRRGDAPAVMGKINRSKTPYVAVLLSTGAAFLTVVVNYYAPAKVFKFLIDSSGADFTAQTTFLQARQTAQIDRCLRMPVSLQHPVLLCQKRKHMSRTPEILRFCILCHTAHGGHGTLSSGNACGCFHIIHGHRKRGFMIVRIIFHHLRKMQLFYIFSGHWHTDQPFSMHCHKIDVFRCGKFRGTYKIALIFAILVIGDKNQFSVS